MSYLDVDNRPEAPRELPARMYVRIDMLSLAIHLLDPANTVVYTDLVGSTAPTIDLASISQAHKANNMPAAQDIEPAISASPRSDDENRQDSARAALKDIFGSPK